MCTGTKVTSIPFSWYLVQCLLLIWGQMGLQSKGQSVEVIHAILQPLDEQLETREHHGCWKGLQKLQLCWRQGGYAGLGKYWHILINLGVQCGHELTNGLCIYCTQLLTLLQ